MPPPDSHHYNHRRETGDDGIKAPWHNDPRRTRLPELTAIPIFHPLSVITCVTFDFFGSIFQ
jgi:hypothetical protein